MTKSDQDILAAQKVLWSFLQEMFNWETHLLAKQKETGNSYFDQKRPEIRESLTQLYAQHLTLKERKRGRLASLDFGLPLTYDPQGEKVVSTQIIEGKSKKIIFNVSYKTYMDFKRRYTMIETKDGWKLDKREDFSDLKGKWISVSL